MTSPAAVAPAGRFIFKGTDGVEAEDFIFAVRQKALAEGKTQDNQWLIDYASGCFARNALRWHATLDRSIKSDWEKLEAAILARYRPVFKGIDGIECEDFLADVRGRIVDEAKEDDSKWIINTVTSSFVGDALRWYLKLDPEVRVDWRLLQVAMITKYPPPDERDWAPSHAIPLPAAAPDWEPAIKKGRIRVEADTASAGGYISRNFYGSSYTITTSTASEALEVQFKVATELFEIEATNFATSKYGYLGMIWSVFPPDLRSNYAVVVGIDKSNMSASYPGRGAPLDRMWLMNADKSLTPTWFSDGTNHSLGVFLSSSPRTLFVSAIGASNYQTSASHSRARLFFEPL